MDTHPNDVRALLNRVTDVTRHYEAIARINGSHFNLLHSCS